MFGKIANARIFSVRNLMRKMKVKLVCTTDDPVDDLALHKQLADEGFEIPVLPAFQARPGNEC